MTFGVSRRPAMGEFVGPLSRVGAEPTLFCLVENDAGVRNTGQLVSLITDAFSLDLMYGWPGHGARGMHGLDDPVAWYADRQARRQDAERVLNEGGRPAKFVLLNGDADAAIVDWANFHPRSIPALAVEHAENLALARALVRQTRATLLVFPDIGRPTTNGPIFLPLDGTYRSESALPYAQRLADHSDADLVLAHAAPDSASIMADPEAYLDRLSTASRQLGIRTRQSFATGEPAVELARLASAENASVIVLASKGPEHSDHGFATDLLARSDRPLLLLRMGYAIDPAHASESGRAVSADSVVDTGLKHS